jgi:hypothetical protein
MVGQAAGRHHVTQQLSMCRSTMGMLLQSVIAQVVIMTSDCC